MTTDKQKEANKEEKDLQLNADWQGVDKAPGEEQGKAEKVTNNDLKGKKVDADPTHDKDKPLDASK